MTASSTPPLHVLRGILRRIKPTSSHPASALTAKAVDIEAVSGSASSGQDASEMTLREHVMAQYRFSASLPPHRASVLRSAAYDFWMLKEDLAERDRLHKLDAGAEEQLGTMEQSRRAAARAGLQLPKMDD